MIRKMILVLAFTVCAFTVKIVLAFAFIVCAFTVIRVFLSIGTSLNNTSQARQHPAITYVELNMPESAENATIIEQKGYGWFYYVEFSAPENDIMNFVAGFCGGQLTQGYDPFNATDTPKISITPDVENYIEVESSGSYQYYSYSMNTPEIHKGNRCWDDDEGYYHILVDECDPDNPSVRVLVGLLSALERYETLNSDE